MVIIPPFLFRSWMGDNHERYFVLCKYLAKDTGNYTTTTSTPDPTTMITAVGTGEDTTAIPIPNPNPPIAIYHF